MQNITDTEFQREVEALKSHRRISVNRPILDPDLPDMAAIRGGGQEIMAPLGSPTGSNTRSSHSGSSGGHSNSNYNRLNPPLSRGGISLVDEVTPAVPGQAPSSSGRQAFTARRRGQAAEAEASGKGIGRARSPRQPESTEAHSGRPTDPSHLFWVPASVHPEISPSDFREFLHDHASRAAREHTDQSAPSSNSTSNFSQFSVVSPTLSSSPTMEGSSSLPTVSLIGRSTSIARRGSTLRRQYRPETDADDEDFAAQRLPMPPRPREGEGNLSISDLQKLEALAEEASKSLDENELRSVLRRTMSLGAGTSTMDTVDAVPATGEDLDSPLIVPAPGHILRRAARTKIRKSSLSTSDDRASRLARRRGIVGQSGASSGGSEADSPLDRPDFAGVAKAMMSRRTSNNSEFSSGGEDDSELSRRPLSEEATESIVDAYSRDSMISDASHRTSVTSMNDASDLLDRSPFKTRLTQPAIVEEEMETPRDHQKAAGYFDMTDSHGQATDRLQVTTEGVPLSDSPLQSPDERQPSGSFQPSVAQRSETAPPASTWPVPVSHVPPVPSFEKTRPSQASPALVNIPVATSQPPPAQPLTTATQRAAAASVPPTAHTSPRGKEKEKKSGFASWFGIGKDEDEGRHPSKEERKKEKQIRKERVREEEMSSTAQQGPAPSASSKEQSKPDMGSFLGALFGKKKGNEDGRDSSGHRFNDGAITAGSLLDQRHQGAGRLSYRYPIHIERAVYRLSHIKLANPRRPLYEQVLISNLMFWYLSIVNRSQQQQQQQQQAQQAIQNHSPASSAASLTESEGPSSAASERASGKGSAALTAAVTDVTTAHAGSEPSPQTSGPIQTKVKKAGLVKPNRAPSGGRPAEMAIPTTSYGAQHRQMSTDMAKAAQVHQQQHQQHQMYNMPSSISVGQIIDSRALQYAAYGQAQGSEAGYRIGDESGSTYDASANPKTSPGLNAQRIVRNSGSHSNGSANEPPANLVNNSGAWLGSGGPRRLGGRSPSDSGEMSWLRDSSGGERMSPQSSQERPRAVSSYESSNVLDRQSQQQQIDLAASSRSYQKSSHPEWPGNQKERDLTGQQYSQTSTNQGFLPRSQSGRGSGNGALSSDHVNLVDSRTSPHRSYSVELSRKTSDGYGYGYGGDSTSGNDASEGRDQSQPHGVVGRASSGNLRMQAASQQEYGVASGMNGRSQSSRSISGSVGRTR